MPPIMRQTLLFLTAIFLTLHNYSQTQEEQVFKMLSDTLQKDPKNTGLLFLRGLAFSETKKYDSAIADFTSALDNLKSQDNKSIWDDDKPLDSAKIIHIRAYCYDITNAIDSAVADYMYLQTIKPNDFMYSIAIARLYINHKHFEKAQIEIDRLKKFVENERGLVYQAVLLYEQNKYSKALNSINVALKKYPNSIEGLVTKAKILGKLDKSEEACKSVSEAKVKITPEYFSGQHGYQRDFDREIDNLENLYCK
ncbi:MAG: tetratricopeptide repeat protein [Chitinophagaceae bacterium]|nr:tetratricopeptide repeat protein [Chitinophagaceae bacterium]